MREYVFRVAIKSEDDLDGVDMTDRILDGVLEKLDGDVSFLEISARPLNEED